MSSQNINFTWNVTGNANQVINDINTSFTQVNANVSKTVNVFESWQGQLVVFQSALSVVENFKSALDSALEPGKQLNSSLAELSAITGQTGDGLKLIENNARKSAKAFGVDAAQAVESYKLLLSQLSPELANKPAALQAMGDSVSVLSKTMGGDATAAASVLTTAMNQYGVSLADPTKASEEMARMMNVMSAASKEGSAELPQIAEALRGAGMAAKAANISFEEMNAAIQVLDKAGKKGAEGGVALRNAISIMGQGRFMPQATQDALAAAGIDVEKLGDTSLTLSQRLRMLSPLLNDSAVLTKMFGMENANSARALINGVAQMDMYTDAITGTNTAYEQADTIMGSYAERQKRIQAQFDDLRISLFNVTGDFGIWTQVVASAAIPLAQLAPLFVGVAKAIQFMSVNWGSFVKSLRVGVVSAVFNLNILKFSVVSAGGTFKFLQLAATTACKGISKAIVSIPVVGWIIGIVTVIVTTFKVLWEKSEGFRRILFGVFEVIKSLFSGFFKLLGNLWSYIKKGALAIADFFVGVWHWIGEGVSHIIAPIVKVFNWIKTNIFSPIIGWFGELWGVATGILQKIIEWMGRVFNPIIQLWNKLTGKTVSAYKKGAEKGSESWLADNPKNSPAGPDGDNPFGMPTPTSPNSMMAQTPTVSSAGKSAASSSGGRIRNINVSIGSLVEQFTVTTNNFKEDASQIKAMVAEALLDAVNDVSYV